MAAKIYAPNKEYTGVSASVSFVNGAGETSNPNLIEWFKERGYKVEEPEDPKEEQVQEPKEEQVQEPAQEPEAKPEKKNKK